MKKTLTKDEIAETLESIALLMELKGENPFKSRAYTNAARAVETYAGDFMQMARDGKLEEIAGIGKSIAEKLTVLVKTGKLPFYEELKAEFPASLFGLFELQGLGAKKIKVLYEKLKVDSIEKLEVESKLGTVAALPGFGEKTAANILKSIEQLRQHAGEFRLGSVAHDAEKIADDLREHPDVIQVAVAGSYRRRKEVVHDLDFIVSTREPEAVSEFFVTHPLVESVQAKGPTKSSVRLKSGVQADIRVVTNEQYPFAIIYFTGSKEHNIVLRGRALQRGWTLNEYRIAPAETKSKKEPEPIPKVRDETEFYQAFGLDFIPPELREDKGEFAAAEAHALPDLIELENLRGTFHNHTTASDGRSSLEEMAEAAQELGLQYLGIADHSKSSFQAHGLSAKQLDEQVAQIKKLNESYEGFRLFTGTECDILKDGSLDFPDEVLAQLDYVVASVHAVFNLSEAEMTKRIIRAMSNPYVTFLGHLTGRLLLKRDGYPVNHAAVIDAAAETGTIIELNANPMRLDMDWRWWQLAKEKGVKCAINPDAHDTEGLQHLWFGVAAARKGWLTRKDVVNCLPLGEIEPVLAAKRKAKK
ncbi:MAG TPA: DNA polymerase/3'-5' exonuclease PolX [Chthoniobacteraceae bacterium]|nr:DNA polymerase/3'-5' exonuclease PolX [Chthoniobacteraceae bacterium]